MAIEEDLPTDLILTCILPKLPVKTLCRFKCVSKYFLASITSPEFIKLQHLHCVSSDSNNLLILPGDNRTLFVYNLDDSPQTPPAICPYPKPKFFAPLMAIVASCECFLLIGGGYIRMDGIVLVNPATQFHLRIPKTRRHCNCCDYYYGLYHDHADNDNFKIARIASCAVREVMIYSLNSNSWRLIEDQPTICEFGDFQLEKDTVLANNHFLYMLFSTRIRCFDMKAERWSKDVILPDELLINNPFVSQDGNFDLGVLDGCLCFSLITEANDASHYDVWMMKEHCVNESWIKLLSFSVHSVFETPNCRWPIQPLAYSRGMRHKVLCTESRTSQLYWYNLMDKEATKVEFKGSSRSRFSKCYVCKGSLLNFPGGQQLVKSRLAEESDLEDQTEGEEDDSDDEREG